MRSVNGVSAVSFVLLCFLSSTGTASDEKKSKSAPVEPCTVQSPHTGSFFDLRPISLLPVPEGKKPHKDQRTESWRAKGHDYHANFTLNVCAPVLEELKDIVGVEQELWRNTSAYYELDGKIYSMG